jgi:hypothetical protein
MYFKLEGPSDMPGWRKYFTHNRLKRIDGDDPVRE